MRPATLLAHLRSQGVTVADDAGQLVLEEAGAPLAEALLEEIRAAKADLLSLLRREAERVTPCPCGECREPGAVQHGPSCYCPSCIALDPELDVYRERADAEDAARKADAEREENEVVRTDRVSGAEAAAEADAAYEAEERLAIQEEGCTPAELEALRTAKSATADAVETDAHERHEPGPRCDQPGPWSWTDPENTPEDVAILRAIERLDREESRETPGSSCYGCGGRDWWRARIGGHLACRRCHPPVPGAEVTP